MEEFPEGNGFRLGLGRCTVDGECDRATPIFDSEQDAHEVRSPYLGYQF